MVSQRIEKLLKQELERLSEPQQERVIEFARSLSQLPKGISGAELLKFAGTMPRDDAAELRAIIDREFGKIDPNDW